jgi:hypothetical protein
MSYNPANYPIVDSDVLRGSLLMTFNNPNNDANAFYTVSVNSALRDQEYTDTTDFFSTYLYVGDVVTVTLFGGLASEFLTVTRTDYTTDVIGEDDGIRTINITSVSGSDSVTFTATTISTSYNFEYHVDMGTLTPPTPTPTPSITATQTPTPSITPTNTVTPTITPTNTVTPTITPTNTVTPTITPTNTVTPTITPTNTITPTITPSITPTNECFYSATFTQYNQPPCTDYQVTNGGAISAIIEYMDCNGVIQTVTVIAGGIAIIAAVLGLINCISGDCGSVTIGVVPTPTPTPTKTPTRTPTMTPTMTMTPTPTLTPSTSYPDGNPKIYMQFALIDLFSISYDYYAYNAYLSWTDGLGNTGRTTPQDLILYSTGSTTASFTTPYFNLPTSWIGTTLGTYSLHFEVCTDRPPVTANYIKSDTSLTLNTGVDYVCFSEAAGGDFINLTNCPTRTTIDYGLCTPYVTPINPNPPRPLQLNDVIFVYVANDVSIG